MSVLFRSSNHRSNAEALDAAKRVEEEAARKAAEEETARKAAEEEAARKAAEEEAARKAAEEEAARKAAEEEAARKAAEEERRRKEEEERLRKEEEERLRKEEEERRRKEEEERLRREADEKERTEIEELLAAGRVLRDKGDPEKAQELFLEALDKQEARFKRTGSDDDRDMLADACRRLAKIGYQMNVRYTEMSAKCYIDAVNAEAEEDYEKADRSRDRGDEYARKAAGCLSASQKYDRRAREIKKKD
ncbi:MAG: hypothetical protein IKI75_12045 [Lachnospiraceae bacterium]|nr:hypothetical protein [Lachnospiraceae bacterium]